MRKEVILPELHINQEKVKAESARWNVLDCGRRWGKSVLATDLICETSIQGWPAGYFAPTYKLLEATFKETYSILEPIVSRKHDNQFIELITGGLIEFWSLDNPNAGRSRKYKRVVIDEAAFVKLLWEAWTKGIRPTLTDLKGDAWFMSTPRGKNDFYKLFSRGTSGELDWKSWQMPTSTNPYIDLSELDDAKRDLPASAYSQEYEALFSDNVANPFGIEFIKKSIRKLSTQPTVAFGVDLAKSHDWTVIVGLDDNGHVSHFDRWQSDWGQTTNRIIQTIGRVPAYIDSTGVGNPIVENITRACSEAEGFTFTSRSKQEIMEGLASSIQKGDLYTIQEMRDELESFEFVYSSTGVKYSAPEGMHDDIVCALALANAMRSKPKIKLRVL